MAFWPDVKRGDTVKHHMVLENNLRHLINSLDGFGSGIARGTTGGVVRIQIWNSTGDAFAAGQPVAFDTQKEMSGHALPAVKVTNTKKPWGVCVNPLDPNAIGDCIIAGPAEVTLSGGSGDYAEPVVNGTRFSRSSTGTARVLFSGDKTIIVLGGASSSSGDYTGMLHLGVETETVNGTKKVYLTVDWPKSGSSDASLVGTFNNTEIHWSNRVEVTADTLVVFDPVDRTVFCVTAGQLFASNWTVIGKYYASSQTVSQLWRSDRPASGLLFEGYTGNFAIGLDRNAGTIRIKNAIYNPSDVPGTTTAGQVSVNNTYYSVPSYSGAAPEGTMYYYVRHRVAQTATSGDEDEDLTEEQKQALRTTIANCDSAISTANAAISQYNQTISDLVTQRTAAYNAISAAYTAYNNGVTAENSRHDAALKALDPADPNYNTKVNAENTLHNSNLSSLASTRNSAITAQQTIISGLDSQIATQRSNITAQQQIIMTQTHTKNAACLQLYGVIPASAGCEIVALPSSQSVAQTDQCLYIYLGSVQRSTSSVPGVSTDYININQAYLGSIMAFYRMDSTCGGLLS